MKSEYHCHCKLCDAKIDMHSKIFPVEMLQVFANLWIIFHVIRHHPEKVKWGFFIKEIFSSIFFVLLWALTSLLAFIVRIICYPFYWLYEYFS